MSAKEIYDVLGEDYNEVISRIGSDRLIVKYLKKFVFADYVSMLSSSIGESRWADLFKASHSLKGVALNLGLSKLASASSQLCESVRSGVPTVDVAPLFEELKEIYDNAIAAILLLD